MGPPEQMPQHDERLARARLALEGLSLGDAFGECFFDHALHGHLVHRRLPAGPWFYTDDTMMAWSIVDVLTVHGTIEQDDLARRFADRYRRQPRRGYGAGAARLLEGIIRGADWRAAAPAIFDGQGSLGNGAAMRVSPVGAYFADDLDRVAAEARASAAVTHAHPDGQAGAVAIAVAAAAACAAQDAAAIPDLLRIAHDWTPAGAVRDGIARAQEIASETPVAAVAALLGSGQKVQAADTVPFALWCAARHLCDFETALWETAAGLGDVDTTCAMVGGIVALSVGRAGLPKAWLRLREPLEE